MLTERQKTNIGLLLGIFGAVFAIYTYVEARQFAQITYMINLETVFRPSKALASSLEIPDGQGPIKERVTQAVITIWNGGNVPFKGEDARTKLTISGDSSVKIRSYSADLTKVLPGSTGFLVSQASNSLVLDWRILDPGEGIQIVLLATGNASSLDVVGRFLPGQDVVRGPIKSFLSSSATMVALFGCVSLLFLFFGAIAPVIERRINSQLPRMAALSVTFMILFFVCLGISFRIMHYAKVYVGDVPPIDPYRTYMDVDTRLDYRYAPM